MRFPDALDFLEHERFLVFRKWFLFYLAGNPACDFLNIVLDFLELYLTALDLLWYGRVYSVTHCNCSYELDPKPNGEIDETTLSQSNG